MAHPLYTVTLTDAKGRLLLLEKSEGRSDNSKYYFTTDDLGRVSKLIDSKVGYPMGSPSTKVPVAFASLQNDKDIEHTIFFNTEYLLEQGRSAIREYAKSSGLTGASFHVAVHGGKAGGPKGQFLVTGSGIRDTYEYLTSALADLGARHYAENVWYIRPDGSKRLVFKKY